MEQLTKNQAVATSQEAVQNQNEPQLRDENAHNDKSVHGVLNPTYQAGLRRDAVQPDIEAERKKRDEIEAGKSYCSRRFGGATCDDKSAQIYARFDKNDWRIQRSEERFSRNAETDLVCRLLLEKKNNEQDLNQSDLYARPLVLLLVIRHTPTSTLFPYTTLFRSPFNQILKQNAKREMRLRLGKVTVADVLAAQPVTTNLLKFMRASIKMIGVS